MHENCLQNDQLISVVDAINNMDDYFCYVRTSGQRPSMSLKEADHNLIIRSITYELHQGRDGQKAGRIF